MLRNSYLLILMAASAAASADAQGYPFSQRGSVSQSVAYTEISIAYGRPVARVGLPDPAVGALDGAGVTEIPATAIISQNGLFAPGLSFVRAEASPNAERSDPAAVGQGQPSVPQIWSSASANAGLRERMPNGPAPVWSDAHITGADHVSGSSGDRFSCFHSSARAASATARGAAASSLT